MTARKITAVVFGALGVMVGAALISGGIWILSQDRDEDDFFKSDAHTFAQESHAIVSEDIEILTETPTWLIDWLTDPVDLRVQGTAADALFLGVASTVDVDAYLAGVAHHEVTDIDFDGSTITAVDYRSVTGTAAPAPPVDQTFWEVSVTGTTEQTLDWGLESGNWTVVVMNADGSSGVDAQLALGAKVSNIVPISLIGLGFGALSLLVGLWLIYRGFSRPPVTKRPADLPREALEDRREPARTGR